MNKVLIESTTLNSTTPIDAVDSREKGIVGEEFVSNLASTAYLKY